jgi:cystathionine gamma-synthase
MKGVETIAVSTGRPVANANEKVPLNHPVTMASNFLGVAYSRCDGTSGTAGLESAVASLEGGTFGLSFSSGMAACAAVFFALAPKVIVLPLVCYISVRDLANEQEKLGHWIVRRVDMTDSKAVLAALAEEPKPDLLWIESPCNPYVQVADLPVLLKAAADAGVRSCVDATFATPVAQIKPLALGASVVMHSATKFIGGHSDLLMGVVVCNEKEIFDQLVNARTTYGATPGSLETFLALRGLRTLPLRFKQHQKNARLVADVLSHHAIVQQVFYPGTGGMVSFIVRGGAAAADAVVAAARVIVAATSLGGVESSWERRNKYASESHVDPGLIRMSVGIESREDVLRDLKQALDAGLRQQPIVSIPQKKNSSNLLVKEAAATVDSGSVVAFETNDFNYERLSRGEKVELETVNVVTGPLFVRDCKAGDTLRVDVLDISIRRCWSVWASDVQTCGCLAAKRSLFSGDASVRELPIDCGTKSVQISERLQVPLRPMIGVVATGSCILCSSV